MIELVFINHDKTLAVKLLYSIFTIALPRYSRVS